MLTLSQKNVATLAMLQLTAGNFVVCKSLQILLFPSSLPPRYMWALLIHTHIKSLLILDFPWGWSSSCDLLSSGNTAWYIEQVETLLARRTFTWSQPVSTPALVQDTVRFCILHQNCHVSLLRADTEELARRRAVCEGCWPGKVSLPPLPFSLLTRRESEGEQAAWTSSILFLKRKHLNLISRRSFMELTFSHAE